MKRILLLSAVMVFTFSIGLPGSPVIIPSAQAQAVNHDAIKETLQDMKKDINLMIQLVEKHKAGTVAIGDETVEFSAAQKTQIITRYNAIKAGLAAKYQALP